MSGPILRTDLVTVFRLRAFVPPDIAERVRADLRTLPGVRHAMITVDPGHETALVSADVEPAAADKVLEDIREIGIDAHDLSLSRDEKITLGGTAPLAETRLAWAAVLGEARANARPISRYLLLMIVAGVIAAFGIMDRNEILIVGAMAVSPDLLPLCAACVAIEARRLRLAGQAVGTLLLGLGLAAVVGTLLGFVLETTNWLPEDFDIRGGGIGTLARVDLSTILVAAAAGVAAMLAFETRASAAVGVAISVTTIPAGAYAGVAAGLGEFDDSAHGLAVLGVNVATLLVTGTATLVAQRLRGSAPSSSRATSRRQSSR
jgi:uncharacterized hydrophobic protein (TIGR00271 family)